MVVITDRVRKDTKFLELKKRRSRKQWRENDPELYSVMSIRVHFSFRLHNLVVYIDKT